MKKTKSFTLIELILYLALVSMILTASVQLAWTVLYMRVKTRVQQEVSQNLRFAGRRILHEIRNANAVQFLSSDDICVINQDLGRNPTRIYLENSRIKIAWGGGSADCTNMTYDEFITANITISSLNFENLSDNIRFTVEVDNVKDRNEWTFREISTSSAKIRSL
jgi:type II secretory pathway pseudopilin PulG